MELLLLSGLAAMGYFMYEMKQPQNNNKKQLNRMPTYSRSSDSEPSTFSDERHIPYFSHDEKSFNNDITVDEGPMSANSSIDKPFYIGRSVNTYTNDYKQTKLDIFTGNSSSIFSKPSKNAVEPLFKPIENATILTSDGKPRTDIGVERGQRFWVNKNANYVTLPVEQISDAPISYAETDLNIKNPSQKQASTLPHPDTGKAIVAHNSGIDMMGDNTKAVQKKVATSCEVPFSSSSGNVSLSRTENPETTRSHGISSCNKNVISHFGSPFSQNPETTSASSSNMMNNNPHYSRSIRHNTANIGETFTNVCNAQGGSIIKNENNIPHGLSKNISSKDSQQPNMIPQIMGNNTCSTETMDMKSPASYRSLDGSSHRESFSNNGLHRTIHAVQVESPFTRSLEKTQKRLVGLQPSLPLPVSINRSINNIDNGSDYIVQDIGWSNTKAKKDMNKSQKDDAPGKELSFGVSYGRAGIADMSSPQGLRPSVSVEPSQSLHMTQNVNIKDQKQRNLDVDHIQHEQSKYTFIDDTIVAARCLPNSEYRLDQIDDNSHTNKVKINDATRNDTTGLASNRVISRGLNQASIPCDEDLKPIHTRIRSALGEDRNNHENNQSFHETSVRLSNAIFDPTITSDSTYDYNYNNIKKAENFVDASKFGVTAVRQNPNNLQELSRITDSAELESKGKGNSMPANTVHHGMHSGFGIMKHPDQTTTGKFTDYDVSFDKTQLKYVKAIGNMPSDQFDSSTHALTSTKIDDNCDAANKFMGSNMTGTTMKSNTQNYTDDVRGRVNSGSTINRFEISHGNRIIGNRDNQLSYVYLTKLPDKYASPLRDLKDMSPNIPVGIQAPMSQEFVVENSRLPNKVLVGHMPGPHVNMVPPHKPMPQIETKKTSVEQRPSHCVLPRNNESNTATLNLTREPKHVRIV